MLVMLVRVHTSIHLRRRCHRSRHGSRCSGSCLPCTLCTLCVRCARCVRCVCAVHAVCAVCAVHAVCAVCAVHAVCAVCAVCEGLPGHRCRLTLTLSDSHRMSLP